MKIGVATASFNLPLRNAIRHAASIGARGVLLDARYEIQSNDFTESARKQLLHLMSELGLKPIGFQYPLRHPLLEPEDLDLRVNSLRNALSLASRFQVGFLTFRVGPIPGTEESKRESEFVRILNDLADHGNRMGVTPCLTLSGDSPDRVLQILDGIKSGLIGVDFDPPAFLAVKLREQDILRTLHHRISHVQVRDAYLDSTGSIRETVVGRGEVDWTEILPTLLEIEYQGWLSVNRTEGNDRVGDSARVIDYLEHLNQGN